MKKPILKFTVFADLHYAKGMYPVSVENLLTILKSAKEFGSEFVLSLGDFCNDYKGSPEILKAFLENPYNLSVYNVYGNHELEAKGNTMDFVTPRLTNRQVFFAGDDVGYYYFDHKNFRIIATDTNYSLNRETNQFEHNHENSWGPPISNDFESSLAPKQLEWLEKTVFSAIDCDKKCIVISHAPLFSARANAPDHLKAQEIFKKANTKKKNTVIMAMNGHIHTHHLNVIDGVCYFDVNTVMNGYWAPQSEHHYEKGQGFDFTNYIDGEKTTTTHFDYIDLEQGKNSWFFNEPLFANVTIFDDGTINILGRETTWAFNIKPEDKIKNKLVDGFMPKIPSITIKI